MVEREVKILHIKESKGEKIFYACNNIWMILLCAVMVYPVLFVLGRSFMEQSFLAKNPLAILPTHFSLEGYQFIFAEQSYMMNAYMVTIARAITGTVCNLFFTILFAYVLSKKYYPGRTVMTFMVVFTMWFSGGLVPYFLVIRGLGLINKFAVYILPGLISAWNLMLLRNFFMSIPSDMEEAAIIDGANDITILFRIYIWLSSPVLATLALFYAVGHWNSWFDSLMFVNNRKLWTLQLMLQQVVSSTNVNSIMDPSAIIEQTIPMEIVKNACIVVATLPIICVYPFLQKYFVKGIMVGSLKG
ncbi:sugar ABC transporter permease [Clostridia bacterium]|nr:sugar ABC transporter permease [Clostridia bacterium]